MQTNYPYLPDGRTIRYVPLENKFMAEAFVMWRDCSSERNHPTGAVIVMGDKIIGKGANQAALKNKKLQQIHKNGLCIRRIFKIPSGQKYWLCPGCAKNRHHAEARAVNDALSKQASIVGADLYLYGHWWCCKPCWDKMIEAGVRDVFLLEGSEILFDINNPQNIMGKQFE